MAEPRAADRVPYDVYVVSELASEVRREFLDGEVFAMAGGTPEHAALAASVSGELRSALRGRPCRVFSSDLRVRIDETNVAVYPDVSVICGAIVTAPSDPDAATNPVVVVEVTSASTEAFDCGAKAAHYRRIPSLREYVLVAQERPHIEVHSRTDAGAWEIREAGPGERVELRSLAAMLDVAVIYNDPLATS